MVLNLIWFLVPLQAVSNFWSLFFCWFSWLRNFKKDLHPFVNKTSWTNQCSIKAQSDVSYPPENCDLASAAGVQTLDFGEDTFACASYVFKCSFLGQNKGFKEPEQYLAKECAFLDIVDSWHDVKSHALFKLLRNGICGNWMWQHVS